MKNSLVKNRQEINVIIKMERISIQIDSVHLRNHRYNFTYKKDEGAEEAIRMLQYMTGLNCT